MCSLRKNPTDHTLPLDCCTTITTSPPPPTPVSMVDHEKHMLNGVRDETGASPNPWAMRQEPDMFVIIFSRSSFQIFRLLLHGRPPPPPPPLQNSTVLLTTFLNITSGLVYLSELF
ncbi:hypothetical protein L1887_23571 [Cichorium endivia]|nr:hypothetical protein L1887_23571 [Cichorium endivia]